MANTSSAQKALRQAARKWEVNQVYRDKIKEARLSLDKAIASGEKKEKLQMLLAGFYKAIDKAAKGRVNVVTQNRAARLKSKYATKVA